MVVISLTNVCENAQCLLNWEILPYPCGAQIETEFGNESKLWEKWKVREKCTLT